MMARRDPLSVQKLRKLSLNLFLNRNRSTILINQLLANHQEFLKVLTEVKFRLSQVLKAIESDKNK